MSEQNFDTPLVLSGPFRAPRQMLAEQEYDGHVSIHDDSMAEKLGFSGAPIEGPTHFSQFVPMLSQIWGNKWFETGVLSAHFQNMVVEGEEVRAHVDLPKAGENHTTLSAEKKDGTPVLIGSASVGSDHPPTLLEDRIAKMRAPEQLVILSEMNVGDKGAEIDRVKMDYDQHLGDSYPFTLNDKLSVITEDSPLHRATGDDSPWGRPIIPLEMVCVLCSYKNKAGWKVKRPTVGLFADLELGMIKGPLFVGQEYNLEREVVAIGETRRTEGFFVKTLVRDVDTNDVLAYSLLQHANMKNSYPDYEKELAAAK
jgi:hypothetical protein